MSTENRSKLKQLLQSHRPGTALLAQWLLQQGVSRELQARYRRSGWLEAIGTGAFKLPGETVSWQGGLYALQVQAQLPIHAGGITALDMQGYAHYLRMGEQAVFLFSPRGTTLAAWFKNHDWQVSIRHVRTSFLPPALGLVKYDEGAFAIDIAGAERAMLECLYLAPQRFDLVECFHVMEGLANLRPRVVQELLAACTSVKVKRLFLYFAERAGHVWLRYVNVQHVDLGRGTRSITPGGAYVPKYDLVVPAELAP